jgi:chromosomal replication initiation ATPase DnaA
MIDFYHIWRAEYPAGNYSDYLTWLSVQWDHYVHDALRFGQEAMQAALASPDAHENFRQYLIAARRLVQDDQSQDLADRSVQDIVKEASRMIVCDPVDLLAHNKILRFVRARYAVIHVAAILRPELSSTQTARALNGRDHSTILHARMRARHLMQYDAPFAQLVQALLAAFGADQTVKVAA